MPDELKRISAELRLEAAGLRKLRGARAVGRAEGLERALEVLESETALSALCGTGPSLWAVWTWYDSVVVDFRPGGSEIDYSLPAGMRTLRLFMGANIGNLFRTNMQMQGQFPSDETNYINGVGIYAACSDEEIFEAIWPGTVISVEVQDKVVFELPAVQLLDRFVDDGSPGARALPSFGRQHCGVADSRGLVVPPRQAFRVTVYSSNVLGKMLRRFSDVAEPGSYYALYVLLQSRRVRS